MISYRKSFIFETPFKYGDIFSVFQKTGEPPLRNMIVSEIKGDRCYLRYFEMWHFIVLKFSEIKKLMKKGRLTLKTGYPKPELKLGQEIEGRKIIALTCHEDRSGVDYVYFIEPDGEEFYYGKVGNFRKLDNKHSCFESDKTDEFKKVVGLK